MSLTLVGLIGIAAMFVLLMSGVPIAFSMALTGAVGIWILEGPGPALAHTLLIPWDEGRSFVMRPEKRLYLATGMPMTQVALRPGLFRDLYVAMGEDLGDGSYAMRVQYKPFVRWLWLGGLLMAFGGILAVADKRYRRAAARQPASSRIDQSPSQEATV